MNQFIVQIKNFLVGLFLLVSIVAQSQITLNVSGQVLFDDGSPAIEAGLILYYETEDIDDFTSTDVNGNYSFSVILDDTYEEGCFTVLMLDCDGLFVDYSDCYTQEDNIFEKDFLFCESGNNSCSTYIFIEPVADSDSIVLSTINLGIGPYDYSWSDGSLETNITLPTNFEGEYCVTVTDSNGCTSDNCIYLEPLDPCFVYISEENGYDGVILEALGFGISEDIDYLWSTSEQTSQIQVTISGEYCVTMTDASGCDAIDCLYVEVDTSEWLDCYAYILEILNENGTLESFFIDAHGESPFTFQWSINGIVSGDSVSIIPDENGQYCATITDAGNCSYTICTDYYNYDDCSVSIFESLDGDPYNELTAYALGEEPIIYNWSNGDNGPIITVEESGVYCVSIVDAVGCESETCYTYTIDTSMNCTGHIVTHFVDNSTALLSVEIMNEETSSSSLFSWSTGEFTENIIVYVPGIYCLEVTFESGCFFEVCTYFTGDSLVFNDGVVISYYDVDQKAGLGAEIELYKVEGENLYFYDILQEYTLTDVNGLFYSEDIDNGTYIARAIPENSDQYIPSYSLDSPFWDESNQFLVENGGAGSKVVKSIYAIPIYEVQGEGTIGGISSWFETNENIMLFHEFEVVGQQFTDNNGQFTFESLPYGTYTLVRERPGFARDEVIVTISADNPIISDVSFNDIVSVVNDAPIYDVNIFPNPTANYINITSELLSRNDANIKLIDLDGKEINTFYQPKKENESVTIDISYLVNGVYIIIIEIGGVTEMKRVMKI